jgi:RHS repeat-associated protein
MGKRYVVWIAVVVALILPAAVLAQEENMDLALAYNDNLGRQGDLPVVTTGSQVYYPSGTYYFSETDLKVAARSVPMIWERTYRSNRVIKGNGRYVFAEPVDGPLGFGWTTPFTVRIENDAYVNAEGRYIFFVKDANGTYLPNQEAGQILKKTAEGYELTTLGGNTQLFNSTGKLTAIRDTRGHSALLTYDAAGRLVAIADVMGREIFTFSYTAENRIARITDLAGSSIDYGYDGFGNLELVAHNGEVLARYAYSSYHGITSKANVLDETYTIEYQYADKGVVSKVIDPEGTARLYAGLPPTGHLMSFQYDFPNRVYYVTDQLGVVRKYTLNSAGKVTSSSEIIGGTEQPKETIEYLENRTTKTTDALGNVVLTQRDEWGNVIKSIDAEGFEWRYTYNTQGKLTSETDPLGTVNRYEYDAFGNRTKEIRAAGTEDESVTSSVYNEYNELTSLVQGEATSSFQYDNAGNLTEVKDPLSHSTSVSYDQVGNLLSRTPPLVGAIVYADYDRQGNPGKVTDANGHFVTYTYDPLGRVVTTTSSADGGVTRYEYGTAGGGNCSSCGGGGSSGQLSALILPEGNRIDYQYDAIGNLVKIFDGEENTIVYTYDAKGNRSKEEIRDAAGLLQKTLSYQYDLLNRPKQTINPDTSFTEFGYDKRGNRTTLKNPNGHTTTYAYDALRRVAKVTQPGSIATAYTYDRRSNLASVTDAGGHTTSYTYDKQNRLIKTISPDSGTTTYSYDKNGNFKTRTDAKGVTATYHYDAASRLTGLSFLEPLDNITNSYDDCPNGKGRLCAIFDPSGLTTYEYTLKGQIAKEIKVIDGQTYTTGYAYDKNGNPTTLKYPSGRVVTSSYANDRVTQVLSNGVPVASGITYKPFGGMTTLTYGNGIQRTVSYDQQYRMASITDAGIQNLAYSYDPNGNITAIADQLDPTKNKTYAYDPLDRLKQAIGPWGDIGFTYDGVGNRLKETNGSEVLYSYQGNRLTTTTGEIQHTFAYDKNGNTIAKDAISFTYNQSQRLIKVTEQKDEQEIIKGEYVYNVLGQRTKKTVDGQTILFFYDYQGKLIAETGFDIADYLYLNDSPIAKIEGNSLYYYHNDHLGTPLRLTNADKAIVWAGELKPFGEAVNVYGLVTNNLRFPGQHFDRESMLHYNNYRDYDPSLGRYIQFDPLGLDGGINPYIYTFNNPINSSDFLGLKPQIFSGSCDPCQGKYIEDQGECHEDNIKCLSKVVWFNIIGRGKCVGKFAVCMQKAYFDALDCVSGG